MKHQTASSAYMQYYPAIRAKCWRMLQDRSAAEDIAQETFTRMWTHRAKLNADTTLPWCYQTSTRLALDVLRRQKRRGEQPLETALNAQDPTDLGAQNDARTELLALAATFPEKEWTVLVLTRIDGLTHAEASKVAQISERTLRRRLQRADARLQKRNPHD